MHHRPRHRAHIAAHTRPMTLAMLPISRSAPQGAHTAKSNLVRPSAAHRSRKRRGGRAAGLGRRFAPSPRPSLRGKGARGHESAAAGNRCGGTGASPIVPPSSTGQTPAVPPIGRARHTRGVDCLPHPPPTHRRRRGRWTEGPKTHLPTPGKKPGSRQETPQPTPGRKPGSRQETPHPRTEGSAGTGDAGNGETRGVRGVGWVVGAGARRAGRPGSRRGRKAPGRLPGRLLLWASAPPRLTSCRQCGKIPHEGSHRRRSQRRPSSMVRQKPGRFRNDRALLYLGHHPRDFRRIKCA